MNNINEDEEICYDFEYLFEGKDYLQNTGSNTKFYGFIY